MLAPATFLIGDELLVAVTEAMVAFHQRYHHRKPVTAKTLMLGDDLLACVLGGVYTDVEKTMIEIQRSTIVQETRNEFQNAMQDKFIKAVERLSGRNVLAFISDHHVGPDIEIELFLLTPDRTSDDRVGSRNLTRTNPASWKQTDHTSPLQKASGGSRAGDVLSGGRLHWRGSCVQPQARARRLGP